MRVRRTAPRAPADRRRFRSTALIDEHHEYLILVAKENCGAAAGRRHRTDLNLDKGLTHTQVDILVFRPTAESLPWTDHRIRDYRGTGTMRDLPFLLALMAEALHTLVVVGPRLLKR
jgi:hypothetical protein